MEKENKIYLLNYCLRYLVTENKLSMLLECRSVKFYYKKREYQGNLYLDCCDGETSIEKYERYPYSQIVYTIEELITVGIPTIIAADEHDIELLRHCERRELERANKAINRYCKRTMTH